MRIDRREFLSSVGLAAAAGIGHGFAAAPAEEPPYNATGELVGEMTPHSAILRARLTKTPVRNNAGYKFPGARDGMNVTDLRKMPVPPGMKISELEGDCPGAPGRVRIWYGTQPSLAGARTTPWSSVDPKRDFTRQIALEGLQPDTIYYYAVEMASERGNKTRKGQTGRFLTAPMPGAWRKTRLALIGNQSYASRDLGSEGFRTYRSLAKFSPDFLVQTGDNVYYDTETPLVNSLELARYHWHRMFSLPTIREFYRNTGAYFQKDDHDSFEDDCWPTREPHRVNPLTYSELTPIYAEQVPVSPKPFRRFRWGKGIELWLLEGRDYRSPNPAPDGPNKTLLGAEQKAWLKKTILESDAKFRILSMPEPIVGPDQPGRDYFQWPGGNGDNLSNAAFATEGHELRRWVKDNKLTNLIEICGDRHWQYFSVDPESGLHEFGCGAVSDTHTVAHFPENPKYHRFLRFKGGFVSISLEGTEESPLLYVRFHSVDGEVVYEHVHKG
jgi:alkaline phosphatase D